MNYIVIILLILLAKAGLNFEVGVTNMILIIAMMGFTAYHEDRYLRFKTISKQNRLSESVDLPKFMDT